MRDRLRHRPRRGVLRAPQGQGADRSVLFQPALDRHHLRADREGAGRQDPAAHHGLRPCRQPRRRGLHLELPAARHLLDGGQRRHPVHRQGVGRLRQAQGQEDRAALSRLALRQGADRGARGDVEEVRLRVPADPGPGAGQRTEVAMAADPPAAARLRSAVGLGRDELRRRHRGRQRQLSARQDAGRVVVGRRARRDPGRRQGGGLQGADAAASRRQVRRPQGRREVRHLAGQVAGQGRRVRPGALQPRPDQLDAGHRSRSAPPWPSSATSR